jgi:hypothetical protein
VQQEEQLQKELNTLREDHAALRKTLEVQTEQSQVGTYGLLELWLKAVDLADGNEHNNEGAASSVIWLRRR